MQRRASAWAFRILQEKKRSTSAHFVTLTYDDAHVPINDHMQLTLDRKEIPLYMKRLRKLHEKIKTKKSKPLKYYAVGEYGEEFERPHYHMILFNAQAELIPLAWAKEKTMLGMCQIGDKGVTAGGAKYLCEYLLTADTQDNRIREKPFSLMSKNLGDNYLTKEMKQWHLQRDGQTIVLPNGTLEKTRTRYYAIHEGYKISLPRYYRDKIFPKIYREIDVPLLTEKFMIEEYKKAENNFTEYNNNKIGIIERNKTTRQKKQKAKQKTTLQQQIQ